MARPLAAELERLIAEDADGGVDRMEILLDELAESAGLPAGFEPSIYLAPGVPRIRPVLVMLASRAAGADEMRTEDVAFSAELLHLAVVVHDAALGRQGGRRRRIARRLLGGAAHWLGGNHLSLRALEVARHAPAPEVLGEALDTLREIAEVQALAEDLRRRDATERDYRDFAEGHTGAVFAFCTRAGGRLAGAPRPVVSALGRYGRHVGVAWHALEDVAVWSLPPDELPNFLARAAATGRPVLPLMRALRAEPQLEKVLDRVLRTGDPKAAIQLSAGIASGGGLRAGRQLVAEETLAARRALRLIEPSPHRDALERIAQMLGRSGAQPTGE